MVGGGRRGAEMLTGAPVDTEGLGNGGRESKAWQWGSCPVSHSPAHMTGR